ncbi:nucleotide-binding alpha-beta plait domain-containing protein [Tanacetum coccineum]
MGVRRSKEDGVYNISTSIFVTNFPDQTNAKELWRLCNQYGNVIYSFIPNRRSKVRKHFGFVRFIKIYEVERLVNNLCTIWIRNFKLNANIAKFNRTPLHKGNHSSNIHANVRPAPVVSSKTHGDSSTYIQAVKAGVNLHSVVSDAKVSKPALLLDDSCLNVSDYSLSLVGKLKEFSSLPNLKMLLVPSFKTAALRPETDHLSPSYDLLKKGSFFTRSWASRNKIARSSILGPASEIQVERKNFIGRVFAVRPSICSTGGS